MVRVVTAWLAALLQPWLTDLSAGPAVCMSPGVRVDLFADAVGVRRRPNSMRWLLRLSSRRWSFTQRCRRVSAASKIPNFHFFGSENALSSDTKNCSKFRRDPTPRTIVLNLITNMLTIATPSESCAAALHAYSNGCGRVRQPQQHRLQNTAAAEPCWIRCSTTLRSKHTLSLQRCAVRSSM